MCVSAVLQGMQAAFFWYFRLAAADASEPAFRANAISLVMAGGVLAGFLGPQTAKWAVDWLAPVTFAGIYVAMAGFSLARDAAGPAAAHSGPHPGRALGRRPAHGPDRAPACLSRGAGGLGVRLCGHDAHHVGDAARHARLRLPVHRQRHRDPGAHHRHVPALVLHRPPDRAHRRAAGDRDGGCHRVRLRAREPGRRRLRQLPDRQHPRRRGVELRLRRRLDAFDYNLCTRRARQGAGKPRLHRVCFDRVGGGAVGHPAGQGRLDRHQPGGPAADGRRGGRRHLADDAAAARGGGPDAGGVERPGIATGICMGDRYDRNQRKVAHPALRGLKPPSEILTWGLSSPARIGHNQGPPLDEPVADAFVRWRWRKAYQEAWKTPSMGIVKLRVARARGGGRHLPRVHARVARLRPTPAGRRRRQARQKALDRIAWNPCRHLAGPARRTERAAAPPDRAVEARNPRGDRPAQ